MIFDPSDIANVAIASMIDHMPGFAAIWRGRLDMTRKQVAQRVTLAIEELLSTNKTETAGFLAWWGRKVHMKYHQHNQPTTSPFHADQLNLDFTKCPDPICLSLYGTLVDLKKTELVHKADGEITPVS